MKIEGTHYLADIWLDSMPNEGALTSIIKEGLGLSEVEILETVSHTFGEKAFTFLALLAESHFSIHTFPEEDYISIDCYTCGDNAKPDRCINHILSKLNIKRSNVSAMKRGKDER